MGEWKRGFPRGKYYPGMEDDFEVAFAPLEKWHRRRLRVEAFLHSSRRAMRDCILGINSLSARKQTEGE